jgi:hypothetical protein
MMNRFVLFLALCVSGLSLSAQTTITSFSPIGGPPGTVLTIKGDNLDSTATLSIGTVPIVLLSVSKTQATAMVMPAVVTGNLNLKTAGGNVVKSGVFTMAPTGVPDMPFSGKLFDPTLAVPANQAFSVAISADGKTAVVGSPSDGIMGSANIYTLSATGWVQQGPKLVGAGATVDTGASNLGIVSQGFAVAINADGNTVAIGGPYDGFGGAVWIFKRNNGVWSQAGDKIAFAAMQGGFFGSKLTISADGNTIIGGGRYSSESNTCVGYIYAYSNGVWTPQFTMLTDDPAQTHTVGSIAISADGNTAAVGCPDAYSGFGGVFIFVRNGNTWVAQGSPVSGSEGYYSDEGTSIALSADGNTLIMGAEFEELTGEGATWVFTRQNGVWTEQAYLIASTAPNADSQGNLVSVSADGNVALVSGSGQSAAWLFTRKDSIWTEGQQLSVKDSIGAGFGGSISLSATGNAAIVGNSADNSGTGAAWFFNTAPSAVTLAATNVAKTQATLNGLVNDNLNLSTVTIEYDTVVTLANPVTATLSSGINPLPAGSGMTRYSSNIAGLDSGMTYYYRIAANYTSGVAQGDVLNFTTLGDAPVITAFSPTSAPAGTMITINGANFNGTSKVLFGGIPATSYSILSANTIQAYVGTGNSGNIAITTPSGTGIDTGFKFITILPPNNFAVSDSSATCVGSNDGSIKVTAQQALNYTATVSGGSVNHTYSFTDTLNIGGLAAGNYSVCINTANQSTLEQCFNLTIGQPPSLSVFAATNAGSDSVHIDMSGGSVYFVNLNGANYKINSSTITLPLAQGVNELSVTTDKPCQGSFAKTFTLLKTAIPYPVPFQNTLNLDLVGVTLKQIGIAIYNVSNGTQAYSNQFNNASGVIQLDVSALKAGIYALHLTGEGKEKIYKVIKE